MNRVKTHINALEIKVNTIGQSKEEGAYREQHNRLILKISDFIKAYKQIKIELFRIIKGISKEEKKMALN